MSFHIDYNSGKGRSILLEPFVFSPLYFLHRISPYITKKKSCSFLLFQFILCFIYMGIYHLLPLFLILHHHFSLADEIGGITNSTNAPPPPPPPPPPVESRTAPFKPGIAAIVGIFTTIFSITFLLLLYVKHCKTDSYPQTSGGNPPARRNSGIDRKVIESLPLFRFSSLRGQKKDGLECAVCLNRFEPAEVLRLLPKCKHAFHVECVDTWLDAHSTCPLCRYRVDPEDVLLVDGGALCEPPPPRRVSGRHSSAGETASLEIVVENPGRRGRVSLDGWRSRRKGGEGVSRVDSWRSRSRRDGQLAVKGEDGDKEHRVEHRIVVCGRRWSDVAAAEMLYVGTEMLLGSGSGVISERSVSEMTGVSRYRGNNGGEREGLEEGVVKRWLAWISQSSQQPAVRSAAAAAAPSSSSFS